MTFSSHMIVARLAWYVYSNADSTVVGKILGKTALGMYSFGWTMANVPIEKVTSMVMRVTPSVLAAARDDHVALRRYVIRITEAIAVITFPATVGIALVAQLFALATLGEAWRGAILPLQFLAVYSGVRSISPLIRTLAALDDTKLAMRCGCYRRARLPDRLRARDQVGRLGWPAPRSCTHPLCSIRCTATSSRPSKAAARGLRGGALARAHRRDRDVRRGAARAALHRQRRQLGDAPAHPLAHGALAYALTLLVGHRGRVQALRGMVTELRGLTHVDGPNEPVTFADAVKFALAAGRLVDDLVVELMTSASPTRTTASRPTAGATLYFQEHPNRRPPARGACCWSATTFPPIPPSAGFAGSR